MQGSTMVSFEVHRLLTNPFIRCFRIVDPTSEIEFVSSRSWTTGIKAISDQKTEFYSVFNQKKDSEVCELSGLDSKKRNWAETRGN